MGSGGRAGGGGGGIREMKHICLPEPPGIVTGSLGVAPLVMSQVLGGGFAPLPFGWCGFTLFSRDMTESGL